MTTSKGIDTSSSGGTNEIQKLRNQEGSGQRKAKPHGNAGWFEKKTVGGWGVRGKEDLLFLQAVRARILQPISSVGREERCKDHVTRILLKHWGQIGYHVTLSYFQGDASWGGSYRMSNSPCQNSRSLLRYRGVWIWGSSLYPSGQPPPTETSSK